MDKRPARDLATEVMIEATDAYLETLDPLIASIPSEDRADAVTLNGQPIRLPGAPVDIQLPDLATNTLFVQQGSPGLDDFGEIRRLLPTEERVIPSFTKRDSQPSSKIHEEIDLLQFVPDKLKPAIERIESDDERDRRAIFHMDLNKVTPEDANAMIQDRNIREKLDLATMAKLTDMVLAEGGDVLERMLVMQQQKTSDAIAGFGPSREQLERDLSDSKAGPVLRNLTPEEKRALEGKGLDGLLREQIPEALDFFATSLRNPLPPSEEVLNRGKLRTAKNGTPPPRDPKKHELSDTEARDLEKNGGASLEKMGIRGRRVWKDSKGGLWLKLPWYLALAHGVFQGNRKFIGLGDNRGREAVYSVDGELVTDPRYAGTFNFFDPIQELWEHLEEEFVKEWILKIEP